MNRIYADFNSFFIDIKNFFIYTYNSMHDFALQYVDDTTLGIIFIALVALIIIFIFRQISER